MGKITETVIRCTCDVCGKKCLEDEGSIEVTVGYNMNSRVFAYGDLKVYIPYGTSNGIICKECKIRLLKQYIQENEV